MQIGEEMTVIYTFEFTEQVKDEDEIRKILQYTSTDELKEQTARKIERMMSDHLAANVVCTKIQVFPEIENE